MTPDNNGGAPTVKHTGDPASVRVTVPPGAPAVSAPVTAEPGPGPTTPVGGGQEPPQPSHMGDPRQMGQPFTPPADIHPEVVSLDVLMELHQGQLRTQRLLTGAMALTIGAILVLIVLRARPEPLDMLEPTA